MQYFYKNMHHSSTMHNSSTVLFTKKKLMSTKILGEFLTILMDTGIKAGDFKEFLTLSGSTYQSEMLSLSLNICSVSSKRFC